jgi:hypothetical protein
VLGTGSGMFLGRTYENQDTASPAADVDRQGKAHLLSLQWESIREMNPFRRRAEFFITPPCLQPFSSSVALQLGSGGSDSHKPYVGNLSYETSEAT